MIKLLNLQEVFLAFLSYGVIGVINEAQASKLVIKNNVNSPVDVIIQHDNESGLMAIDTPADSPEIKFIIGAGEEKTYEVTKKEISYNKKFSVTGKVNFYSLSNHTRCSDLRLNEDYRITLDSKEGGGVLCSYVPLNPVNKSPAKVKK